MKIIFIACICILVEFCFGQSLEEKKRLLDPRNYANGMTYVSDNELQVRGANLSDSEILDTTKYVVKYRFIYSDISKNQKNGEPMRLEIGRSMTAFYSEELFEIDSLTTLLIKRGKPRDINTNSTRYHIYKNIQNDRCEIINRLPFHSGEAIVVEDSTMPKWQIDTIACTILEYDCWRAVTKFGGRNWIVWFAPSIPIQTGPWKLGGLPGLILRAEDDKGLYSFDCEVIECKEIPIKKYKWRCIRMNKQEWLKFEKRMHTAPFSVFGGNTLIISGEKASRLDETWSIPYNPLELE